MSTLSQQASNSTGATSFTILNNQQLDVAGLKGKDPQGQVHRVTRA